MQVANTQPSVRLSLLLATVCMVFLMVGGSAGADIPTPAPREYVVEPGDTLWSIASDAARPEHDVRRLVADISRISDIDNGVIFPGQILLIPST